MTPRNADPTIGERIQARRLLRGWSIRHAAGRAGVSHATWSRIERGRQAADNRFKAWLGAERCRDAAAAGDPVLRGYARDTNPAIIPAGFRQVFFYAETARALARMRGRDREAIRFLLTAERIAPQHIHTSAVARETTRALLERSRRQAGGTELRGLCQRMQVAL
jgi:transcriptional regulator with XRE-family HTH domain